MKNITLHLSVSHSRSVANTSTACVVLISSEKPQSVKIVVQALELTLHGEPRFALHVLRGFDTLLDLARACSKLMRTLSLRARLVTRKFIDACVEINEEGVHFEEHFEVRIIALPLVPHSCPTGGCGLRC